MSSNCWSRSPLCGKRGAGHIHEHLPPQARKQLKEVGWAKGIELAKLARRDGQHFDCATWLHKARQMPKEDFRKEVEKELTGRENRLFTSSCTRAKCRLWRKRLRRPL